VFNVDGTKENQKFFRGLGIWQEMSGGQGFVFAVYLGEWDYWCSFL
jgi:hypothetical protein